MSAKLAAAVDVVENLPAPQRMLSEPAVTELVDEYQKLRG